MTNNGPGTRPFGEWTQFDVWVFASDVSDVKDNFDVDSDVEEVAGPPKTPPIVVDLSKSPPKLRRKRKAVKTIVEELRHAVAHRNDLLDTRVGIEKLARVVLEATEDLTARLEIAC